MNTLTSPGSKILQQGSDMFKILNDYPKSFFLTDSKSVDKHKLGLIVKWERGNHVIQINERFYICEKIEDADIV